MASQDDFKAILNFTLKEEGGYVDDPLGGATNFGITQDTYNGILHSLGLLTRHDVKELITDEVGAIYYWQYWLKAGCDRLATKTASVHFDVAVNCGVHEAITLLQQTLKISPATGYFGLLTTAAVNTSSDLVTAKAYILKLRDYYGVLKNYGGNYAKDYQGWINRTNALALWLELN